MSRRWTRTASAISQETATAICLLEMEMLPGLTDTADGTVDWHRTTTCTKDLLGFGHEGHAQSGSSVAQEDSWKGQLALLLANTGQVCGSVGQTCIPCQLVKIVCPIHPPLKPILVGKPPVSDLEINVIGPLPESEGYRYFLTTLCRTSRLLGAIPRVNSTSVDCYNSFI